jgi:hypothetical protein
MFPTSSAPLASLRTLVTEQSAPLTPLLTMQAPLRTRQAIPSAPPAPRHALLASTMVLLAPLLAAAPAFGLPALVNATIEPSQISLGQTAELTITSSGSSLEPVALPEVAGLEFRVIGQSHRVELISGATLVTTALMVRVTPKAAGVYTIPGLTPKSQPLVLRVNPDSGAPTVPDRLNGAAKLPSAGGAGTGAGGDGIHMTPDGSAFVRLIVPKREVYVGESVPVRIEVGMRNGFVTSLNGLPTLTGADFTLNNLSRQPERGPKTIDGREFTVLTWHSVLAAVKPGKFSLSVESPLTVRVRTRAPRESMLEDSLGDPFMQNFFGVTVPKDITVASPPADLTVLPLPTEGRPPDFSGAVGSFTIASDVTPAARAGDPLTLRLHVTGTGNFDRVDTGMLEHLEAWKTYPPTSSFKPAGPLGDKGEKTFEQPLIASKPGSQTLPGLAFSYFDPAAHRYETAHTPPLTVTIAPEADRSQPATSMPAATAANAANPSGVAGLAGAANAPADTTANAAANAAAGLRPDHPAVSTHDSLLPLYLQPRFLAFPLLSLAVAGGWAGLRRRAPADGVGPTTAAQRGAARATRRMVEQLAAAGRAGNATLFFNVARSALLPAVGTELEAESAEIRQIFALADEANYSGQQPTTTDFERWLQVVTRRLGQAPQPRPT